MYPPTADEPHCTTTSQMAASTVKVVALTPLWDQGETEAKPRPEPIAINTRVNETATRVPARTAGQETAETEDSLVRPRPLAGGFMPSRLTLAIVYPP